MVAVLLGWLLAGEALTARVGLASFAILGAIMLIRKGERVVKRPAVTAGPAEAEPAQCA